MTNLSKDAKRKLRKDTRSYHVTAVLDKTASERALAPLPTQVAVQAKDGTRLVLITTEAQTSCSQGKRK